MHPIKVHLFGSENNGWALDTDLSLTRKSLLGLEGLVQLTSLAEADVVHSVWEEPLLRLDAHLLEGKRIVCHVCNNLLRLHENSCMIKAPDTVGLWVAMAREAVDDLESLSYPSVFVPYSVDTDTFQPLNQSGGTKEELRRKHGLPAGSFVISNFMRDSFGHDLTIPKEQKGGELLLELGRSLKEKSIPVHFLLAGPCRHWIRGKFREYDIPFTFVGQETPKFDIDCNIASAELINELYCASDLHLLTSRWEGGPRSVLEAAATRTPILSTPVGVATDILQPESLYRSFDEGLSKIEHHFCQQNLEATLERQYQTILLNHTAESNVAPFGKLYEGIAEVPTFSLASRWRSKPCSQSPLPLRIVNRVRSVLGLAPAEKPLCISLWHEFHKPPYGGGNQFMLALQKGLENQGVRVVTNKVSSIVDVHICNSCWFDHAKLQRQSNAKHLLMIHRIDGPTTLYRGKGRGEDEKIFELNRDLASATVFQSGYSFRKSYELGFRGISPVIISNSVNREIFHSQGRAHWDGKEKIRLVSSAWSDNPRKGGPFLKWLDGQLDWERFEYTFIGRVQEEFEHIRHIPAVASDELASMLREHHIYISPSLHEPCSNALLEALACGLPTLYRNDGGNPELVSFAGFPFEGEGDVLEKLERLVSNLPSMQALISIKEIDAIAAQYIALARQMIAWEGGSCEAS